MVLSRNISRFFFLFELSIIFFINLLSSGKFSNDCRIKYLIIQTLSSLLFLMFLFCFFNTNFIFLIHLIIFIKIGFWPFYDWIISICQKMSWPCIFLMITLQKINPLWVLRFFRFNFLSYFCIIINRLIVIFLSFNQVSIRLLFCYLSIQHISWATGAIYIDWLICLFYVINYLIISFYFVIYLSEYQSDNIYILGFIHIDFFLLSISILCIAGLPPLGGFLAKFFLFFSFVNHNQIYIGLFLVFLRCCVFFVYCRFLISRCVLSFYKSNEFFFCKSGIFIPTFCFFSHLLRFFFIFCYFFCV